jgi:two-component system chemotaxis response regulator CheB
MRIIRALVVDDSAFVRKVMRQMLSRSPFIEVVGTARDGAEALTLVEQLKPDVVTLDLNMPGADGVTFLKAQMARQPLPVIVVTMAAKDGLQVVEALEAGAIDVIQKPTALATDKIVEISEELIAKVKAASATSLRPVSPVLASCAASLPARPPAKTDIVVIAVSTGGPQALKFLIPRLPGEFPVPIAIVLHMPVGYTALYAKSLNEASALDVVEASQGDELRPGRVLLAPAGHHLTFAKGQDGCAFAQLSLSPFDTPHRPSADVLFKSAADLFGERTLGIVLTGMGSDGTQGASWIKAKGGRILVEAEESCVVYGMPRSVVEAGLYDTCLPLGKMANALLESL